MYGTTCQILTAVHPDTVERISRILQGHKLVIVQTMEAAKSALDAGGIDLIFVGARFDESRMFDLLDFLRGHAEHHRIPIAAAVIIPMKMTPDALKGMAHAVKIYGASLFVNLNDFPDEPMENNRVRLILETLCAPSHELARVVRGEPRG